MSGNAGFDVDAFLARPLTARLATNGPTLRPVWYLWEDHPFWIITGSWSRLHAKPDPAIYARALELLETPGSQTLVVGDSPRDDVGGVPLKIRTLTLTQTEGPVHGLGTVLQMVGNGAHT